MRIFLSGIIVGLSLAISHSVAAVEQVELEPQKLADIKANCVGMQVVLQKIQYNDAANRVNRGQAYESLVNRMMIPMNGRTAVNGLSSSTATLAGITTRYQQKLNKFKSNYESYDNSLTAALRVKCQQKPADFYRYITEARKHRTDISNDIVELNQLIEEYYQAIVKLKDEL